MGALLLAGLGELVTVDGSGPDGLGIVRDVAVVVDDGRIAWIGPDAAAPALEASPTFTPSAPTNTSS